MTIEAYFHLHHDQLMDFLAEPIENRIEWVRTHKPAHEIETRLRLMRPVRGVPQALVSAWAPYAKTWAAYEKARAAYEKALAAYEKPRAAYNKASDVHRKAYFAWVDAYSAHLPELEALHREQCPDCPWDGETIFPEGGEP